MTRKNFEQAALIVQRIGTGAAAECVENAFVEFFRADNPRFDEHRFRRACVPGADVKARS